MTNSKLFSPIKIGDLTFKNRIVMAPMTRCRSAQPGNIPTSLMATYYAQRASAGLIITEATQVSPDGQGYSFTPGIHSPAQVEGWRHVTEAVHKHDGKIFLQLWHVGRLSHESFHGEGHPLAPSAITSASRVWVADEAGVGHMRDCAEPKAMSLDNIERVIGDFRRGALNAIEAGFDGVEIHGANGYLIDQFLRTTSNKRTDTYGGSPQNRIRFALDVATAVASAIGPERTGMRFSPFIKQRDMIDPEAPDVTLLAAKHLHLFGLGYLHLVVTDWDETQANLIEFHKALRENYGGKIIVAGNYTKEKAEFSLTTSSVDMIAFGRPFIANPDLPLRFAEGWTLANFDPTKLYGGTGEGYTDYPTHKE